MNSFVVDQQIPVGKEWVEYTVGKSNSVTSFWYKYCIVNYQFQVGVAVGTFFSYCFEIELNGLQMKKKVGIGC